MVLWAEGYCKAAFGLVQTLSTMPVVDPSTSARAAVTTRELLTSVIGGLDGSLATLAKLGPSPVAGGSAVRDNAAKSFTGIRTRAAEARQRLEVAKDPSAVKKALADAGGPLDDISRLDLMRGLHSVPELALASRLAPSCQQLSPPGETGSPLSRQGN
ncbi:hypothetical protein SAMN05421504_102398 [Amycolatopsis xylanica]|uniref:Uncharacterized protein n=1 Tax=Amycolatopsis xylanica TaxID=589385 RepID=A0A1H2Z847_9PSEU|nr:hypothetical protein SAMN05421504_102398 [Amycolatopsis xylanica]